MTQKDIDVGKMNDTIRRKMGINPYDVKCKLCGSKEVYDIVLVNNIPHTFFRKTGYKGVEHIVCKRCFTINVWFNNWAYLFVKFLVKFL